MARVLLSLARRSPQRRLGCARSTPAAGGQLGRYHERSLFHPNLERPTQIEACRSQLAPKAAPRARDSLRVPTRTPFRTAAHALGPPLPGLTARTVSGLWAVA